jgi:hypothetical protein
MINGVRSIQKLNPSKEGPQQASEVFFDHPKSRGKMNSTKAGGTNPAPKRGKRIITGTRKGQNGVAQQAYRK